MRLISQFVEKMNLTALYGAYERVPSEKYASPTVFLKILIYAYHERKEISPRIIEKTADVISITCILSKTLLFDHATIARFRTEHFAKCSQGMISHMTYICNGA